MDHNDLMINAFLGNIYTVIKIIHSGKVNIADKDHQLLCEIQANRFTKNEAVNNFYSISQNIKIILYTRIYALFIL